MFLPRRALSAIPPPPQELSFEVATIKPIDPENRSGKFIRNAEYPAFETRNWQFCLAGITSPYEFFSRFAGNRVASEDLVQEVFARILKYRILAV